MQTRYASIRSGAETESLREKKKRTEIVLES